MTLSMQGKVCLVTGATSGIGKVAARELARKGATVVGVGRSAEKCTAVAESIRSQTGGPTPDFLLADLSSMAQVSALAETFKSRYSRLDVLVNNAGGYFATRQVTADGYELTFALNHLAYFLLTNLLLALLKTSAPARIVSVSSGAHFGSQMDFDDLQGQRHYNGWPAYSRSKLANLLFTYELSRKLEGSGVTANALHPGFVASNFALNNARALAGVVKVVQKLVARTPEKGAETVIYLATSPEVEGVSGKYFVDCKPVRSSDASYDELAARKLWQVSEELTK